MKIKNPKTPKFYITPKIYKENPRGPVTDSIKDPISEISSFLKHHLQLLVKEIPSYIKGTNDFVKKINNYQVPENSLLVTTYVKALYIRIPNIEDIAAVKGKYNNYTKKTVARKVITIFFALIRETYLSSHGRNLPAIYVSLMIFV